MLFLELRDARLAQTAYLIGCEATREAVIIDPERDVDRYIDIAASKGFRIVAATETHIHADFLSGVRELAEQVGATVLLSAQGGADWTYQWLDQRSDGGTYDHVLLHDGDEFAVGHVRFRAVHTPGHTPEHLCFEVTDTASGAGTPIGVCTGDFVFVGNLGRPDLLEVAAKIEGAREAGAHDLHRSAQSFLTLPDYLQVWPGHGAGSACGKSMGHMPVSTVGYERLANPALSLAEDEASFVEYILADQPDPPLYFARMKALNRDGVPLLGALPVLEDLGPEELASLDGRAVAILDTRPWPSFAAGHLPGSLFPLSGVSFLKAVGSFVEPDEDIVLICEREDREDLTRALVRIGLDRVVGWASPSAVTVALERIGGGASIEEVEPASVQSMADDGASILDVRGTAEYDAGAIDGATHVPHTVLADHLDDLPDGEPIIVHCAGGVRSAAACSLLARRGVRVCNLRGGYSAWCATASGCSTGGC